jgi:hypothetical protein
VESTVDNSERCPCPCDDCASWRYCGVEKKACADFLNYVLRDQCRNEDREPTRRIYREIFPTEVGL